VVAARTAFEKGHFGDRLYYRTEALIAELALEILEVMRLERDREDRIGGVMEL